MYKDVFIRIADAGTITRKKFTNKHLAIVNGRIIGYGNTVIEALNMACKKVPNLNTKDILLRYVPQKESLIL
ncbi:MAG: DUF5678 domain-containing protein [Elusimicrobiota bacterium]